MGPCLREVSHRQGPLTIRGSISRLREVSHRQGPLTIRGSISRLQFKNTFY